MGMLDDIGQLWRSRAWRIVILVAVGLIGLTALGGGFRKAIVLSQAAEPRTLGMTGESGAFQVTPLDAWITHLPPGKSVATAPVLVVRMRVVNLTETGHAAAAYFNEDLVRLLDGDAIRKLDDLRRTDTASAYVDLPPRLPVDVEAVWSLDTGDLPRVIDLGLRQRIPVTATYLTGGKAWASRRGGVRWKLSVRDVRAAAEAT